MTYRYEATREEERAAALLRSKGWEVREPPCPECHDLGGVGTFEHHGEGPTAIHMYGWKPCPRGCPQPVMIF